MSGRMVVASGAEIAAAVELAVVLNPEEILLSLSLTELAGIDALRRLYAVAPAARVTIVSPGGVSCFPESQWPGVTADQRTLRARPESAKEARGFVSQACVAAANEELVEDASLVATELVANALAHAGTVVGFAVRARPREVRIEVGDGVTDRPVPRLADLESGGGRGLMLVDALSSAWGVEPTSAGKTVWAEVAAPRPDRVFP